MDKKLKLYTISNDYISYLRSYDSRVLSNSGENYHFERLYLGIVTKINNFCYYIPLSSPKITDYIISKKGNRTIRKSVIPIIRMVERTKSGEYLLGKLKISSMIPVIDTEVTEYSLESEENRSYKQLIHKQCIFIRKNNSLISEHAKILYHQKINHTPNINYLNSTIDFLLLEQKAIEYGIGRQLPSTANDIWH